MRWKVVVEYESGGDIRQIAETDAAAAEMLLDILPRLGEIFQLRVTQCDREVATQKLVKEYLDDRKQD